MIQNSPTEMRQLTGHQQQTGSGGEPNTLWIFFFFFFCLEEKKKLRGDWIVLYFRKRSHRIWLLDSQKRQRVKCSNGWVQRQQMLSWERAPSITPLLHAVSTEAAGRVGRAARTQTGARGRILRRQVQAPFRRRLTAGKLVPPATNRVRRIHSNR